jgi:ABC-type phosphate transport system auxiliary subunit
MALRTKLDKVTFDTLPADVKKEYEQHGDDYILGVEDLDSLPAVASLRADLTRAKTNEVGEHNKTKEKLRLSEDRVRELEEGDKTRTNDTKLIEERHKTKLKVVEDESAAKVKAREDQLCAILVDAEAQRIAAEISVEPDVILPHIRSRLQLI